MGKKCNIIEKIMPPSPKQGSIIPENLCLPNSPYVSCTCEYSLSEERFAKIPPTSNSHLIGGHRRLTHPIDVEVVPYSLTEITIEEQMNNIFFDQKRTENTSVIINMPMSSLHHIPCIQLIHQKKPSKHFLS
jgi:hypothetical protein